MGNQGFKNKWLVQDRENIEKDDSLEGYDDDSDKANRKDREKQPTSLGKLR